MHCSTFFAKAKRVFDVQKTAESKVSALLYTFHFEYLALLSSECAGTLNISVRSGCEAERSVFGQKNVSNHSNVFFLFPKGILVTVSRLRFRQIQIGTRISPSLPARDSAA